jgi:ABC-type dipeptide/oligopeptide/nickel transport system permease component
MIPFIVRRLVSLPVPLLLVTFVVFVMLRLSGDPSDLYLPPDASSEQRIALQRDLGLDQPLLVQYGHFLWGLTQGNFGRSLRYEQPALSVVLDRLPATIELTLAGLLIAILVAIPLGLLGARMVGRAADHAIVNISLFLQSMPSFWLGLVLITIFGVQLQLLPTSGRGGFWHLLLPAVTVSLFLLPQTLLLTRASALDVLGEDYVRSAWAKGLPPLHVFAIHVAPNALNPVISYLGLQVGRLLGGAVITETVFAWPGLGQLSIQGVFQRDMAIVQASILVMAILITAANLIADILNGLLDPRIKMS